MIIWINMAALATILNFRIAILIQMVIYKSMSIYNGYTINQIKIEYTKDFEIFLRQLFREPCVEFKEKWLDKYVLKTGMLLL